MKRKIIRQGHNTLTVTLPSKWAQKYGVRPGNEIDINEQDKSLIISTENENSNLLKTMIDISGLKTPVIIWRYILSAYRAGYDEIMITGIEHGEKSLYTPFTFNTLAFLKPDDFATMSPIETIGACVNRLIGMEITEQKGNCCIIKDLSETTYKEFESALKRISLLLKTEAENIANGFTGNKQDLKAIHIIDTNLDRFEDYCLRVLNKKGYDDFRKTPTIYSIVFTMEMVGDEFKKIAGHILEMKSKHSAAISRLFKVQRNQLDRFCSLFNNFSKKKIEEIYEEDKSGSELITRLYDELNDEEKELLHHFKKIGIYLLSLTELVLDLQF